MYDVENTIKIKKEIIKTMSKKEVIENEVTNVSSTNEVLAHIIKDDEGNYRVVDEVTGEIGEPCKLTKDDGIALTPNRANRLWIAVAKAEALLATQGRVDLVYKATKKLGPVSDRIPNKELLAYMDDATREEYLAIVAEAKAKMEEAKKTPLTEKEKLLAQIERAKKKLAAFDETSDEE